MHYIFIATYNNTDHKLLVSAANETRAYRVALEQAMSAFPGAAVSDIILTLDLVA